MAELHYFPLMAADWLAGEATSMMTPEQEGAFIRLLCYAWQSSGVPCSLPNDDATLAHLSRLGRRWKKAGAFVKAQFDVMPDDPTRLRNSKLWAVFSDATAKHEKRVRSGKAGGIAKAAANPPAKQTASNALAMPEQRASKPLAMSSNQNQNQSKKEETATTSPPPAAAVIVKPSHETWLTPYCDAWKAQYGGDMDVGPAIRPLSKLRTQYGDPETLRRWTIYLAATGGSYANASKFAATWGEWSEPPNRLALTGGKPSISEQNAASMRRIFSGEAKL